MASRIALRNCYACNAYKRLPFGGPDGGYSLCGGCFNRYAAHAMRLYRTHRGISARASADAEIVKVVKFNQCPSNRVQLDRIRPIVQPVSKVEYDRYPYPVAPEEKRFVLAQVEIAEGRRSSRAVEEEEEEEVEEEEEEEVEDCENMESNSDGNGYDRAAALGKRRRESDVAADATNSEYSIERKGLSPNEDIERATAKRGICDEFGVKVEVSKLIRGMQLVPIRVKRRLSIKFDSTWEVVDSVLKDTAKLFDLREPWDVCYVDGAGDLIVLNDQHDLEEMAEHAKMIKAFSLADAKKRPTVTLKMAELRKTEEKSDAADVGNILFTGV